MLPFPHNLFVVGLQRSKGQHDAIRVIVDLLTKSTYFLLIKVHDGLDKLAHYTLKIFFKCMECLWVLYRIGILNSYPDFAKFNIQIDK